MRWLLVLMVLLWSWLPSHARTLSRYPCESDLVEVMFDASTTARLRGGRVVDLATASRPLAAAVLQSLPGIRWSRVSPVSEARVDALRQVGQAKRVTPLYDLNNIYRLQIPPGVDVWEFCQRLEASPDVHRARPVPLPVRLPAPGDYQSQQNYLGPAALAPTGVDAEFAWRLPGGDGSGVTICDLEYEWNDNHADVPKLLGSQINSDLGSAGYGNDHGTAVAGMLVAADNGWGVTGISPGASLLTCGTYYGAVPYPTWNVPGAMILAMSQLQAGDVILLENQWDVTGQQDYVPVEWWTDYYPAAQSYNAVYAAIETAVANGIHVVETGGNGEGSADSLTWYGDSGAIIVGAGGAYAGGVYPAGDLQRLYFSTYGSRFDLQGWGENVVTTGYGDLYSADGPDYFFTAEFSGTSSSGPTVAGVVADCVGYWKANVAAPLPTPNALRTLLIQTGTPQLIPPAGHIGPRPDLRQALNALSPTSVDLPTPVAPRLRLEQNSPNPLNPSTVIRFGGIAAESATLEIFDMRGRRVRELYRGPLSEELQELRWDGTDALGKAVASGAYFVRLRTPTASEVVRAVVVR